MKTVAELYPEQAKRVGEDGLVYLDVRAVPQIRLSGLAWKEKNGNYHRMDDAFESEYTLGVNIRSNNTSGVQATVKTNTKTIGVHMVLNKPDFMEHMPDNGVAGVDIFKGNGLQKRFWQIAACYNRESEYTRVFSCDGQLEDYTFNLPLYSGVEKMEIGLLPDAVISEPEPYAVQKPVLVHGSSITQGGCASRPGNCYVNMLSRMLNVEIINLGFSSNARGDEIVAKLIAGLDISAFIYDYDHNAADAKYLKKTHKKFFQIIRDAKPDLPIIMMTKPDYDDNPVEGEKRKAVIYQTYMSAVKAGDQNVYFIDGSQLFGHDFFRDCCTVDRNHPTDLGFSRMAAGVAPVLKLALGLV